VRQFQTRDAVGETPTAAVETTALPKNSLMIPERIAYHLEHRMCAVQYTEGGFVDESFCYNADIQKGRGTLSGTQRATDLGRRVVVTTFGSLGDLHPYLALGLGLRGRGHEVVIATGKCYRDKIEALGLGFAALRPDCDWVTDPERMRRLSHPHWGLLRVLQMQLGSLREAYEDTLAASEGAGLLVGNLAAYATRLVAEKTGTPWASVMRISMMCFSAYDPPLLPGLPLVSILMDSRNRPQSLPDGVVAFDYVPFSELFPRAAAVVHHGGIGTTGLAMRAGCPTLVMPCAWDQEDNAERAARLGIARTIPRRSYTPARVATELRRLLDDPAYARRAAEVAVQVRKEDGVRVACEALSALLPMASANMVIGDRTKRSTE
jgi:UDP:flavonoid glycosyltransferase YjiC (YdhE family)